VLFFNTRSTSAQHLFNDFDQDGLSNEEENVLGTDPYNPDTDGDGYSDYTEVMGGYDPLKPAPGDRIIPDITTSTSSEDSDTEQTTSIEQENITQKTAAKLAGMTDEAFSTNSEITLESVEELVNEAMSEANKPIELPEVSEEDIRILKQDYDDLDDDERDEREREDASQYLASVAYIMASATSSGGAQFTDESSVTNFVGNEIAAAATSYASGNYSLIEQWAKRGEEALESLREVEVPENMLDIHKQGPQIALYALSLKEVSEPDVNDPLETIANLSRMQGFLSLISNYQQTVSAKLSELDITEIPLEL
jgi:hypothetical protein